MPGTHIQLATTHRRGGLRPPWTDEARIRQFCTSCGDCIRACPEAILFAGPARTPVVNFAHGECTFCTACAEVCDEPVFEPTRTPPWTNVAAISAGCLLTQGVACRICTDTCDTRALRFDPRVHPSGRITLDTDACTGCGACIGPCPVGAIEITPAPKRTASDEHLRMPRTRRA